MPLNTVYQLRNFFLEHKPPTMDKTIFLILLKKIKTVFASKYCKEENIEKLNSFINDRINSVLC